MQSRSHALVGDEPCPCVCEAADESMPVCFAREVLGRHVEDAVAVDLCAFPYEAFREREGDVFGRAHSQ